MMLLNVSQFLFMFLLYGCCGWAVEVIYCMIMDTKKNRKFTITNRGFLTGPICPIYSFGAMLILATLSPFKDNIVGLFFMGIFVCDTIEYITSLIMEKVFGARWWDYSTYFLNINGRICLRHSIMWGILSVVVIEVIHPFVKNNILGMFGERETIYITAGLLLIFLCDILTTLINTYHIRDVQLKIKKMRNAFFEDLSSDAHARRELVSSYASELRDYIGITNRKNKKGVRRILKQYPGLVDLMKNEIYEIQSIPHEFIDELKQVQADLEDMFGEQYKDEMH